MDSLKDYLKDQFNRVTHIADTETDMLATSYAKANAEYKNVYDILMQTVNMKIKLLLEENPQVYIATVWWCQPCRTDQLSIWRTEKEAFQTADKEIGGDGCGYSDGNVVTESTKEGIHVKDFKNSKLLKEFAIRELEENLYDYTEKYPIYQYLHKQYDFLSKEANAKWEIVLKTKEGNYYIDTKNETIDLYAQLLEKDRENPVGGTRAAPEGSHFVGSRTAHPNAPVEQLKKMALKELKN